MSRDVRIGLVAHVILRSPGPRRLVIARTIPFSVKADEEPQVSEPVPHRSLMSLRALTSESHVV
ncbi:hypothetical protein MCOR31_005909 [Pyricularia oryzae]|nr:hypothetical protein MCOR31_005909 [Pyricularia oryzae]